MPSGIYDRSSIARRNAMVRKFNDDPDWTEVINELRSTGLTNNSIARMAETEPTEITALKNKRIKQPAYPTGMKLMKFYYQHMRRFHEAINER